MTQSSPLGYSIFDIMTRIVPGLTVVIPLAIAYALGDFRIEIGFQPTIVVLILGGLLIGEIIDLLRSGLFPIPSPFTQVLYHHTEDKTILSRWDRADLWVSNRLPGRLKPQFLVTETGRRTVFDGSDFDFQDVFENQFELEFESSTPYLLYSAFRSHMDARMSSQTRRYYVLRIFAQNLMFASILSTIVAGWVALTNLDNDLAVVVGLVSGVVLMTAFVVGLLTSTAAYPYIDELIIDYYVDRLDAE